MPKKLNKPKSKHTNFPTMQFRLAGDDWLIAVWNPNNKQACYFLAEPTEYGAPRSNPHGKKEPLGFIVSSLEREGIARSVFPSLPRLFKTTDKAAEWLEDQVESYAGDEFTSSIPLHGESASKLLAGVPGEKISTVMGERADRTMHTEHNGIDFVDAPAPAKRQRGAKKTSRAELDGEIITEAHSLAADIKLKMGAL